MKRNLLKLLVLSIMLSVFLIVKPINADASEDTIKVNMVLQLSEDVDIKEKADANAATVGELSQGKSVIVAEEAVDGWIKIKYQDIEGYIQLVNVATEQESGLAEEFEKISNDNRLIFERMEYINSLSLQKLLWGIVIVLIVIAMFAVGIISSVIKNKNK